MIAKICRRLALLAGGIFMTGSGVALGAGCNNQYCLANTAGCTATNVIVSEICCRDEDDNGTWHCVTCSRRQFECTDGGQTVTIKGTAYNCTNPGSVCC